jgi:hypothetical protein
LVRDGRKMMTSVFQLLFKDGVRGNDILPV